MFGNNITYYPPNEIVHYQHIDDNTLGNNLEESWSGAQYDQYSEIQRFLDKAFLDRITPVVVPTLTQQPTILDIGSGNGYLTQRMRSDYFPHANIIGVDKFQTMVEFAKQHYSSDHITFRVDDAEQLATVDSNSIDLATSFLCYHWIKNQQQAFANAYRVLKPGQYFVALFCSKNDYEDPMGDACYEVMQHPRWKSYFENKQSDHWILNTESDLRKWLSDAGFKDIEITQRALAYRFENKTASMRTLYNVFESVKKNVPKEHHQAIIEATIDLYLEKTTRWQTELPIIIHYDTFTEIAAHKPLRD